MLSGSRIMTWLRTREPEVLDGLWAAADQVRRAWVGDAVHVRGIVEISNHCVRACAYCGIRGPRRLTRYRMTREEILRAAARVARLGWGTVVLQAGEDPVLTGEWIRDVVERIKGETGLAVTLSLGERDPEELAAWRRAGADRYLLRFETASSELFRRIHPGSRIGRVELLGILRDLGYQVGSGVLVGFPGQTWSELADSLGLMAELRLDMVGSGPWIPHPGTPMGDPHWCGPLPKDQVPFAVPRPAWWSGPWPTDPTMGHKVLALTRLLLPAARIPATTALDVQGSGQRLAGLTKGADVLMPDVTPAGYRRLYEIYPGRPDSVVPGRPAPRGGGEGDLAPEDLTRAITGLGRVVGRGPGHAPATRHARSAPGSPRVQAPDMEVDHGSVP